MTTTLQIQAYLVKGLNDIETKIVHVNDKNYMLVRKRLEYENKRAIDVLKVLKEDGEINSLCRPKGYGIQSELKELIRVKKEIKKSIKKISEFYYK